MRVGNDGEVDVTEDNFENDLPWGLRLVGGRLIEARLVDAGSDYLRTFISLSVADEHAQLRIEDDGRVEAEAEDDTTGDEVGGESPEVSERRAISRLTSGG